MTEERRMRVLAVDDEPANLNLLRQILKTDYDLAFAKSGSEALANIQKQVPDLVLLDVMMPGMDGHEACRLIKADPRVAHVPVIFCTAMTEEGDEAKGFALGAIDYITKPVRPTVVQARVRTHLALANQARTVREEVRKAHKDLLDSRLRSLMMLGKAAEFKDNETGLHVARMAKYAETLARASGWNDENCETLLHVAPMHDIGKISTPDSILRKPGKLDPEELSVMREHCRKGGDIIERASTDTPLFRMARDIALYHHEKWDGTGYPHGVAGEAIPLSARVAAIADVFDALTTARPYKDAWTTDKAFEFLREQAGKHFDPALVEAFVALRPQIEEIRRQLMEPKAA